MFMLARMRWTRRAGQTVTIQRQVEAGRFVVGAVSDHGENRLLTRQHEADTVCQPRHVAKIGQRQIGAIFS